MPTPETALDTTPRDTAPPLIVDLDRDLLRGNLRSELFWSAVRDDWRRLIGQRGGGQPDATRLPLDPAARNTCETARAEGRAVILADCGAPELAAAIAAHLECFDSIEPGRAAAPIAAPVPRPPLMPTILRQMRPHQWVKNVLVFLPLVAAHAFDPASLGWAALAFVAFGLIASGVYVLNDLTDLAADRRHPTKRNRPFASGVLPLRFGLPMLAVLVAAGFAVAALVSPALIAALGVYFLLTTAYSMKLKGLLAVDIIVLAMLYTMRIVAGAAATGIMPSVWLLTFSVFLFLSLAAIKRLVELVDLDTRAGVKAAAGRAYTVEDRPIVAMIATSAGFLAVLVLALYLDSPEVRAQYDQPMVLWGICLVLLFWVSRIVLLAHRGLVDQDPVVFALSDGVSRISGAVMVALFAAAILA
jgi:4-hydroxybenzoate polyprenyltransferase